ncbi:hypothetical protein [Verrucomicrobium spinosum]|uniref:hypothetical protein n=1 Tax=Verrucomicrobium spinosum TaxID=2736 RepID=UPI000AF6131A|nr:hypothetical protein [Verrucomicrobium spinosum]
MKRFLASLFSLACAAPILAAGGPLRVLYYDASGAEQSQLGPLHPAMAELAGRPFSLTMWQART